MKGYALHHFIQDHFVNFNSIVHEAFRSKTLLNVGFNLFAKGEMFKLHDEFLVVYLIFFSKSNAGIMIFIARDFCSGERCGPWAPC